MAHVALWRATLWRAMECEAVVKSARTADNQKENHAMKTAIVAIAFTALLSFAALAADAGCCKVCCRGPMCVMTHNAAHDCLKHAPCK